MVRRLANGLWEGRLTIGMDENKKPIFHYFYEHNQQDFMQALRRNQNYFQGVSLCQKCRMPLGDWLDQWLKQYAAPSVRPSTLSRYQSYMDRYIKPRLGDKPVYKVTAQDVQELYATLQESGRVQKHSKRGKTLSASTIHNIHTAFHQAMDTAVREHLIARNPTEDVKLPPLEEVHQVVLNDEQMDRFLELIQQDETWCDFFYTELTCGLRVGELCGLQWEDFDPVKGTLAVRRTVHRQEGGGFSTGDPKTDEGIRSITLPPSTLEILTQRKKTALPVAWIFHDPVDPEKPISPAKASRRFKEFLREGNLPL